MGGLKGTAQGVVFLLLIFQCVVALGMQTSTLDAPRRGLLHPGANNQKHDTNSRQAIRVELMHRDHPSSPLSPSSPRTFTERFGEAVKRSRARRDHIARNMKASGTSAAYSSPVSFGNGEYLMEISLGTPAQKFSAIVDTGSDLVWVQSLPCAACYTQTGPMFDPAKSRTYRGVSCNNNLCQALPSQVCAKSDCQYQYTYGDESTTSGDFAYETVTFGGAAGIPNFAFGSGHTNLGTFAGAGGLVGLGQGPISLPSQLSSTVPNKFSYCLVSLKSSVTTTSPMFIGDASYGGAGFTYTPIVSNPINPTYYYAHVTGITVAGKALTIPAGTFDIDSSGTGGVILDSGTTITYFNSNAYMPILSAFMSAVKYPPVDGFFYGLDLCFDVTGVSNPTFPDMVVHFTNADFVLTAENNFVFVDTTNTVVCLAMGSSSEFSIFGNIQQQDHEVVYDNVNRRIGFRSVSCDTL